MNSLKVFYAVLLICAVSYGAQTAPADAAVSQDKAPQGKSIDLLINKKYLNFPVKNGAEKRLISLWVDGKKLREFDIELAPQQPDFWVFLDVSKFHNRKTTLTIDRYDEQNDKGFDSVRQADDFPGQDSLYKEKLRPQFHFTSQRGWNNDTNGMAWYAGEYHLFYQHNPFGWKWGNMTWGHAVSKDLVGWTELGDAIHPDQLGTIYSGSAVVDENNTAGFGTGKEKPIVCFYTSAGDKNQWSKGKPFTQSIAYSNDRGRTWTKYQGNPVLDNIAGGNRDPKVFWHQPSGQWVMVLFLRGKELAFLASDNLKNWQLQSKLESFYECPELFALPVDGNNKNQKWILYGGSGDYFVGEFDGKAFAPQTDKIRFQYGNCFYASQTFNNILETDGRRVQMAWGKVAMPGMPFNQMILFPVCLTLHTTDDGLRMFVQPVKEIKKLYDKKHKRKNFVLKPGENPLKDIAGELFHIKIRMKAQNAQSCRLAVRSVDVICRFDNQTLACLDKSAPLKPADGNIEIEILVDRMSVEIFADGGAVYMPMGVNLADKPRTLGLLAEGGDIKIESLEVYTLNSIWQ